MVNGIKYSGSSETNVLNKGDWYIGTGVFGQGSSQSSGYWASLNPPDGGYSIYKPSDLIFGIRVPKNDVECLGVLKEYGYTGDSINDALLWSQSQDDILVVNSPFDQIITDGLVLYLDAGYVSSYPRTGTVWKDLSGQGNDGTLVNGPTFDSANLGSIQFDGSNDYVRIPNSTELQFGLGSFTAFAWIYPSGTNNVRIINTRGTGAGGNYKGYQFKLDQNGSNWYFNDCSIDDATGNYKSCNGCGSSYPLNNWYYINMVYETQNELRFYVNGVLDGTVSVGTYGSLTNTLPTAIGASISNQGVEGSESQYYNGKIPVVGLYNRALTPQEVLQNYNATKSRFGL